MELVITCALCGAMRSTHGFAEIPFLSEGRVLAAAGHAPLCPVKLAGTVVRESRPDMPDVAFYRIEEAGHAAV